MSRQVTNEQYDEILGAIHGIRMIASVITDSADELHRDGEGEDWQLDAMMGSRLAYFALVQFDAVERLEGLVKAALEYRPA